jgi:DNA-binding winged helix-turn-helix (wHTH) protein
VDFGKERVELFPVGRIGRVDVTFMHVSDDAAPIDEVRDGHARSSKRVERARAGVEGDANPIGALLQEAIGVAPMLVDVDRDDVDAAWPVVAIERVEGAKHLGALRTPARPELDEHHAASEVHQPSGYALGPAQFNRRGHPLRRDRGSSQPADREQHDRAEAPVSQPSHLRRPAPWPILGALPLIFRDLSFDAGTRQVSRGGREIKLTRKAFDLLALLIDRRPEAVSKDDIHARLWPDTFVSEITLHSLVSEIRRGLADDSADPQFIRTVHGFGYAFICPPTEAPAPPAPVAHRRVRGWLIRDTERLQLFDGENLFGRGDPDVMELPSTTVSRRHARITVDADAWLEDLGSKNGTFVGDRQVTTATQLHDGDRIRFGSLLMTFRMARSADATRTESTFLV